MEPRAVLVAQADQAAAVQEETVVQLVALVRQIQVVAAEDQVVKQILSLTQVTVVLVLLLFVKLAQ